MNNTVNLSPTGENISYRSDENPFFLRTDLYFVWYFTLTYANYKGPLWCVHNRTCHSQCWMGWANTSVQWAPMRDRIVFLTFSRMFLFICGSSVYARRIRAAFGFLYFLFVSSWNVFVQREQRSLLLCFIHNCSRHWQDLHEREKGVTHTPIRGKSSSYFAEVMMISSEL